MSPKVEKRRATLINIAYVVALLAIVYIFFKYLFWPTSPFLLSFFFAVLLQKPIRFLDKKTKNKCHTLWSILCVVVCILIMVGPVVGILVAIGKEVASFISYLGTVLSDLPTFLADLENTILNLLKFLPDGLYSSVEASVTETFSGLIDDFDISKIGVSTSSITSVLSSGISGVIGVAKNIPSNLIALVIFIIAWIFFTKDYDYVVAFLKKQLPDKNKNLLSEIKQIFSTTILKMVRAYALIMFITFCELFLGLSILNLIGVSNNSYTLIIAICIAIFDILPVAGSGGILIPWSLISFIMGNYGQGIGLLIIYVAISVIRQYIEPKIVGSSLGVHPLITLAGLYFGLKLFGVMGMFIVPILVMTIKAFNDAGRIHLYKSVDRN